MYFSALTVCLKQQITRTYAHVMYGAYCEE